MEKGEAALNTSHRSTVKYKNRPQAATNGRWTGRMNATLLMLPLLGFFHMSAMTTVLCWGDLSGSIKCLPLDIGLSYGKVLPPGSQRAS